MAQLKPKNCSLKRSCYFKSEPLDSANYENGSIRKIVDNEQSCNDLLSDDFQADRAGHGLKIERCNNSDNCDKTSRLNLKFKLDSAIARVRSAGNNCCKKNDLLEVDLKVWEDFYAYHIKMVCDFLPEFCATEEESKADVKLIFPVKVEDPQFDFHDFEPVWKPPRSPHNLIEETLYNNPWALLVATIFLNKTSCKLARPCLMAFLAQFPDPKTVLSKKPKDFEKYFAGIGLKRRRSEQVWKMSWDYVNKDWKDVRELYGIGKYGQDAFRMFCLGDLSVEPEDRFLRIYKAWYHLTFKDEEKKVVD